MSRPDDRTHRRPIGITVLTPDGPTVATVTKQADRSRVAKHLNSVRRYLELGDDRRLREFDGATVETASGERLELVTDLATIDRLAEGGEVWFELYRS